MAAANGETGPPTEREPTCSTCGEVVHRSGHVWAHAEPTRVYGHVARVRTSMDRMGLYAGRGIAAKEATDG
jgi:hypothetical protein